VFTSLRLKNILNILTVCLRVFFGACLAESTLTYPQPFPASRDELGEKPGLEVIDEDSNSSSMEKEIMAKHTVLLFKPYPMAVGQKIYIAGGPRGGDWEVIEVSERKVKLRCPVSFREFEWNRFCYFAEEQQDREWPQQ